MRQQNNPPARRTDSARFTPLAGPPRKLKRVFHCGYSIRDPFRGTYLQVGGGCLRLIRLSVPPYKTRGEMVTLVCDYELEGERLYAVKWYKENEEFYRYVPRNRPQHIAYEVEGIRVNLEQSNPTQVSLRSVNLKSSGTYKCEVSAEAPSFSSASKEAKMEVIYFPSQPPYITGNSKETYFVGDELKMNCSSPKSYPAPNLDWYINDVKVPEIGGSLQRYEPKFFVHNLQMSLVTLRLRVLSHYFKGGRMKLKCVASLPSSFFQIDKESDGQIVAPLLEQRESLLIVKADGSQLGSTLIMIMLLAFITLSA
ncbi:hypothetical protein GE061_017878 [Apolygus lucorum]|uniref:Ig-like domain-containing protein n=1 Tax=Apolygus lucorum TaxID=248454 RepID=A0A8S9XC85_APOLU|nr:hypothetical protein GE061_017878 [Apolygus lucorum]